MADADEGDLPVGREDPRLPERGQPRTPGWREVLLLAGLVLVAVFAVEILSAAFPALGDLFRSFPTTIVILVVGTVGLLVLLAVRRPRQ